MLILRCAIRPDDLRELNRAIGLQIVLERGNLAGHAGEAHVISRHRRGVAVGAQIFADRAASLAARTDLRVGNRALFLHLSTRVSITSAEEEFLGPGLPALSR
jgi:hypothetical protein